MGADPGITSIQHAGFTVESNSSTKEEMVEEFKAREAPEKTGEDVVQDEEVSKAASELGKKGGKAAAEKRAAEKDKAEEAKPEAKAKDSEDEEKEPELGKRAKARVEQATREAAQLKRTVEAERKERQALSAELVKLRSELDKVGRGEPREPKDAKTERKPGDKPREQDYDDYAEYVADTARWAARQEHEQLQQNSQIQQRAKTFADAVQSSVQKFSAKLDQARANDPEFLDRVSPEVMDLTPSFQLEPGTQPTAENILADEVVTSEQAPAVMIYLSEHPDVYKRILGLSSPRAIAREVAKIEARFDDATAGTPPSSSQQPSKVAVSNAAPPVRPVKGEAPIAETGYREGMSFDDYARIRMKQLRSQR